MTRERLKELNEIQKEIDHIKKNINALNSSENIQDNFIKLGPNDFSFLDSKYVNFNALKQLTLDSLKEKLESLEKEFNEE